MTCVCLTVNIDYQSDCTEFQYCQSIHIIQVYESNKKKKRLIDTKTSQYITIINVNVDIITGNLYPAEGLYKVPFGADAN